jgi:hypothetical protein
MSLSERMPGFIRSGRCRQTFLLFQHGKLVPELLGEVIGAADAGNAGRRSGSSKCSTACYGGMVRRGAVTFMVSFFSIYNSL